VLVHLQVNIEEETFINVTDSPVQIDMYAADGQNWGMPLYNWEEMKKEDYRWWRERLRASERYFDLFRIDHVVGIYRVWGIENNKKAVEGSYFPSDEKEWIPQGLSDIYHIRKNSTDQCLCRRRNIKDDAGEQQDASHRRRLRNCSKLCTSESPKAGYLWNEGSSMGKIVGQGG